ncbi:hypothetical protein [Polaribacter cellanae]|uniref:Uncharacterized protein n=1 Tax=Polaribacter cellanae TaxID=2818493 RepID=A0A975CKU5_9FLAO|nr:hypothetical protein [Polaribacter cellanae]QTE21085.1 hypothetical protein J3359_09505 [Polaribacter cellanae]
MGAFRYTSVHQYLDEVLGQIQNPTDSQIKKAKQAYWKIYYGYYRKQKRKTRKEFTLGFYPDQLEQIHQKRENLSVSEFLYNCVFLILKNDAISFANNYQLDELYQKVMELITLVEELLEEHTYQKIEEILLRLETIEEQFTTLQEGKL